jgi:hypothetical protein
MVPGLPDYMPHVIFFIRFKSKISTVRARKQRNDHLDKEREILNDENWPKTKVELNLFFVDRVRCGL